MAAGLALEDRAAQTCLYQPVLQAERRYNMEAGQKWRQYMAAGAANLGILAVGLTMGWTSPTIPKLNNNATSPLDDLITPDQESWIGSLITVGAAIGPLYSGVGADMFGRRLMILSSGIPLIIGWVLAATAKGVGQLYAARIVWGLATGQLFTCVPMYVGEIAEDDVRGALGSFLQMFITVGFLLAYAIGPFVSYLALTIVSVVPVIIFMVVFFFMPDSPAYLIKKGRKQQATIALQKLRGKSEQGVLQELNDLQSSQDVSDAGEKAQFSDLWTNRGNFKSLYLACGLVSLQQLSGINVVLFYMETIFDKAGSGMDPAISTIIIGVVQVLASSVTPFVVDRLGRKLLLNISSIGMTFALLLLGLFFILDNYESPAVEYLSWLPIAALVLFMCVYCIGFGPLPWAVIGELLDPSIKSLVSTIATTVCWVVGFIITKFFGSIGDAIGMHFAFWIFAVFTFLAFFFVQFLLPETKGRSLQEIQDLLNGKKISKTEKS